MKMTILSTAVAIAIAFSSCKKNVSDGEQAMQSESSTLKAKSWFEKQSATLPTSFRANTAALSFKNDKPQWEHAKFFPEEKISLIPVATDHQSTTATKVSTYLLVQETADGSVEGGYYCYILSKSSLPSIRPAFITGTVPESFNGSILRYSLDGNLIGSSNYANGQLTGVKNKIIQKKRAYEAKDNPDGQNIVPVDEGCQYVTIDWYYQQYVDGVLVFEEYLCSSTEIVCEGGGGSQSPEAACAEQALNFLNQGHSASTLVSMTDETSPDSLRYSAYPNWKIYSAGPWGILSYETFVWTRASKNQAYAFSSYATRGDAAVGVVVGGTRTYQIISKIPTPLGPAHTSVHLRIDFTVTSKADKCLGIEFPALAVPEVAGMKFLPPITVIYGN